MYFKNLEIEVWINQFFDTILFPYFFPTLESEGRLTLDYAVELKGAQAEHNHFTLRVLPAFDRPKDL